jgi:hypothetical protein
VDTYIVRIYRRAGSGRERLVGLVKKVGVEGERRFADLRGLGKLLALPENRGTRRRRQPDGSRRDTS